jgi:hypothetical protein
MTEELRRTRKKNAIASEIRRAAGDVRQIRLDHWPLELLRGGIGIAATLHGLLSRVSCANQYLSQVQYGLCHKPRKTLYENTVSGNLVFHAVRHENAG